MTENHQQRLAQLFVRHYGQQPTHSTVLNPHASDRVYFRFTLNSKTCIGTYSENVSTNQLFFNQAKLLNDSQIPSTRVLIVDETQKYYLQEDLGELNALEFLERNRADHEKILKQVVRLAADMHYRVTKRANKESEEFVQVIVQDCDQFITHFIKPLFAQVPKGLIEELDHVVAATKGIPEELMSFVHRDFQLRNIVISDSNISVVDFQNALYAPCVYDLASLLFSSRLDLTVPQIDAYIEEYCSYMSSCYQKTFACDLRHYVYQVGVARLIQALGSYGRVGIKANKKSFLDSIAKAQKNLLKIITILRKDYSEVFPVLEQFAQDSLVFPKAITSIPVELVSFSYKDNQIPELHPRHINLVFDARMFTNPGRDTELKKLTGRDKAIQNYITQAPEYNNFVDAITQTITSAYQSTYAFSAPITQVCVYVGCTGGRHRSVASVELVYQKLVGKGFQVSKKHLNI